MKAIGFPSAAFALALALAGCKSSPQTTTDAGASDAIAARDMAQPDGAPDGIAGIADKAPGPADASSQPEVNGQDVRDDILADIAVSDGLGKDATVTNDLGKDAAMTNDLGKDVATDLRAPVVDLAAEPPAADAPSADRPGGETRSEAGCSGWTTLVRLSPADAANLITTSNPIVINVHIPYAGDIPGTDVDIPYNNVDAIEAYLNYDHCADLLLVCESGGMSQSAGNDLIKRGYLRVRDINGGMSAWVAAGYTLLKDGGV